MDRIPVGVLGATGIVGQRFVELLAGHPWFEVTALAASDRTAGRLYGEACPWLLPTPMPEVARGLAVSPLEPALDCRLVFSALPAEVAGPAEEQFARAGYAVCSNASAHRLEPDVPLLIPEVNPDHTALIPLQRRRQNWPGLIVTSPNCSAAAIVLTLKPLQEAFGLRRVSVVTMQSVSGAGYPGVPAPDILGNVIPFIAGEEEKVEQEPRKMLGRLQGEEVVPAGLTISAQCNRVPVPDGHTACLSVELERPAELPDVTAALEAFRAAPEVASLPSSPARPILVRRETDRPQPARDREAGKGMAVSVGRVRPCPLFGFKFILLGHNTVRGAAGGAIHNAELLVAQGWVARTEGTAITDR